MWALQEQSDRFSSYVANLCKEIAYYEDRLHKSTGEQETTQDPAPAPLVQQSEALHTSELPIRIGDAESSRQNEGGSITSLVHATFHLKLLI